MQRVNAARRNAKSLTSPPHFRLHSFPPPRQALRQKIFSRRWRMARRKRHPSRAIKHTPLASPVRHKEIRLRRTCDAQNRSPFCALNRTETDPDTAAKRPPATPPSTAERDRLPAPKRQETCRGRKTHGRAPPGAAHRQRKHRPTDAPVRKNGSRPAAENGKEKSSSPATVRRPGSCERAQNRLPWAALKAAGYPPKRGPYRPNGSPATSRRGRNKGT